MNTRIDVALILWNPDVIELLSLMLYRRHLKSCGVEPSEDADTIERLIVLNNPSVVVFDLGPPYELSAAVALHLLDRFPDRSFVMTCADSCLARKAAPWLFCYPMFEKPYEISAMVNMVHELVRRVPERMVALSIAAR